MRIFSIPMLRFVPTRPGVLLLVCMATGGAGAADPEQAPVQPSSSGQVQGAPGSAQAVDRPVAPGASPSEGQSGPDAALPAAKPPAKSEATPALDLTGLEKQLKETKAIGILTKLTLKNQVDDLVSQFRAYYRGRLKSSLAELRRPYDLLILKVVALLQDGDPPLAQTIVASRESIWGILSDPVKFAALVED